MVSVADLVGLFPNLVTLDMTCCLQFEELSALAQLLNLTGLPNLTRLYLHSILLPAAQVGSNAIRALTANNSQCQLTLTELYLNNSERLTTAALVSLQHLPNLTVLSLEHVETVNVEVIEVISSQCQQLDTLMVTGCHKFDDVCMDFLTQFASNLAYLNVRCCPLVTTGAIQALDEARGGGLESYVN